MTDTIFDVAEFYSALGEPFRQDPGLPDQDRCCLKADLLDEEIGELRTALAARDIVAVGDALIDIQYILDGAFMEFGLAGLKHDLFAEVHRSNMAKRDADGRVIRRPDGKIQKPAGWTPPNLHSIIHPNFDPA